MSFLLYSFLLSLASAAPPSPLGFSPPFPLFFRPCRFTPSLSLSLCSATVRAPPHSATYILLVFRVFVSFSPLFFSFFFLSYLCCSSCPSSVLLSLTKAAPQIQGQIKQKGGQNTEIWRRKGRHGQALVRLSAPEAIPCASCEKLLRNMA